MIASAQITTDLQKKISALAIPNSSSQATSYRDDYQLELFHFYL